MADNENPRVKHIRSSVCVNGVPKAPSADTIDYGEIAVNFSTEQPSLFIKNNDDEIVRFVDQEYVDKKQDKLYSSGPNQNIKTINGYSVLGQGDLVIDGGEGVDIPKLFWIGALPTAKSEGNLKGSVLWVSKTEQFECYGTLKVQGNSTTAYNKKNFTLTLYEDAECTTKFEKDFKWGEQSKYVMKANWIDLSHARNIVGARIWGKMVETREHFEDYPEELKTSPNYGVVDGFPIKFYANGIYWGRYSFNIPKDAWMANMDKENEEQVILCSENYPGGCFHALPKIDETDWTDELHSTVPQTIKDSFSAAVNFVMTANDATFKEELNNYFDVESLIDYYIFGIVACHLDGFGKNQMFQKYSGTTYIAQVYDMDSTVGLWWNGTYFVSPTYTREQYQDYAEPAGGGGNLLYQKLARVFADEISERWIALRDNVLSINNLVLEYEKWTDICPKELVEEDYSNTTGDGAFTGIPSKETNNIGQIRNYLAKRRVYMEEKLGPISRYYDINVSQTIVHSGDTVNVTISTNLESSASTFNVSGPATLDTNTMILTINDNAVQGDIVTIVATSTIDTAYTNSININVVEGTSDVFIWTNKTTDGTTFIEELENGTDGDIDFNAGDYIEFKVNYLNETSINSELMGFGTNISEYNNTIHLNNQQLPSQNTWIMFKSWLQTTAGNDSIQQGYNMHGELYVRYKNDGVYYSADGETYNKIDWGAKQAIFDAWYDSTTGNSTVQIGSVQGTHPNGTYYDYVKIVKNGVPTYSYTLEANKLQAEPGDSVKITVITNLTSSASTFEVEGPCTFDSGTTMLTINPTAVTGSTVSITGTSIYDSTFTDSVSIDIVEIIHTYSLSLDKEQEVAGGTVVVTLTTDLPNTASTFNVNGPATFNSSTMLLTIDSTATTGSVITLTATSDYDSSYTDSATVTVIDAPSDVVLITGKTADGTSYVRTFTNGLAGDANFAAGDYLEYKIDFANETRAGELLGFGQSISVYNENLHFANEAIPSANKWVRWNSYVHTASSSGSIQKGLNANGTVFYVRYKSDGIYYSRDGETYELLDLGSTQQPLYEGWWEASIANASNLQVGWNYNNSHPNGTYYEYVKIVKNSSPVYNYSIEASKSEAIKSDNVTITVDTNLASTASTFSVTGPATINQSTGVLTIDSTATTGSEVVVDATSSVNTAYTATTTISIVAPSYAVIVEKTGATQNESVYVSISTNLSSTASTFNVSGPATFNSSTMLLTIDSTAATGSVVTIEATSTVDNNMTASTTVTVIDSSETILWSNVTLGSTPISRTLTNGVDGDINFDAGDYIEMKFDTTDETIGNARIFSFGSPIESYNNTLNIEKQMNGNSWVVFMGWFEVSVRSGFNPGYVFYTRLTKDGIFYSSDGINYTEVVLDDNPPTGAGTPYYRAWWTNTVAASTVEVGHKYNNLPNGTKWIYVKIVRA